MGSAVQQRAQSNASSLHQHPWASRLVEESADMRVCCCNAFNALVSAGINYSLLGVVHVCHIE